jgi:MFS family permease
VSAPSLGVFRSLRSHNYRLWAAGALVSNVGTWMQRVAQDWLVLTQLTHHDASAVGTVMALQFGPQLLLLPWTGVAADRFDQRRLLMATQGALGVLALALGALTVTGVVTLVSLALLRRSELRPSPRARRTKGSFVEGFRYVWRRPDLRAILVMLFLIGTFGLNFPIFISTMAVRVFHTDARGYGLLSSTMAIGTISGSLLAARGEARFSSLLSGAGVFGLGCFLAAIAPSYALFGAALVVIGVAALTFTTATNSLMQLSTEPAMRGRVMAIRVAIALGGTPIGAPIVGWVADHFGPRWSLGIGAAAGFAAALVAVGSIARRRPTPPASAGERPDEDGDVAPGAHRRSNGRIGGSRR